MKSQRIFISNLPQSTKEDELRKLCENYGKVERVEIKSKTNPFDESGSSVIAFVTLSISPHDLDYCINELNYHNIRGATLKVAVAKESFLDRLKREREENDQYNGNKNDFNSSHKSSFQDFTENKHNTRKVYKEDEVFDDVTPELLISKKRASNSMKNGKIVIDKTDTAAPLHIIEMKKASHKSQQDLGAKELSAEQKRKDSLLKMNQQYEQQKLAVQQALAHIDTSKAKKIKFSDDEDENDVPVTETKAKLFSDEENDDNNALVIPSCKGKKAERLARIQTKQSLDPRFRMNENFLADDDENESGDNDEKNNTCEQTGEKEHDQQLRILNQIIDTEVSNPIASNAVKNKKMLRFDPSKEDHQNLLRRNEMQKHDLKSKQENENNIDRINSTEPKVSKELFYVVTDTLQQSLKSRGDGFSLLSMFKREVDNAEHQRELDLKDLSKEKILLNRTEKRNVDALFLNEFNSNISSSDENEDENVEETESKKVNKNQTKGKVTGETFFIMKNDKRLKEGAKLFIRNKENSEDENYEEVRNRLKLLIKTKMAKTRKNLNLSGVKRRKIKRSR